MKLPFLAIAASLLLVGCNVPETAALGDDKASPDQPQSAAAGDKTTSSASAVSGTDGTLPPTASASAASAASSTPSATNAPAPSVVAAPPLLPPNLPESAREIVKLAHSQVGDGVLTNYIAGLKEPFELDAEQIVYLRDLGISPAVIEALLVRQQQLEGARANPPATASKDSTAQETPTVTATLSATNAPTVYPGSTPALPAPQVGPAETVATDAVNTEPQAPVTNYNYFYDSLAPYGNWITVPSYGYVWQPTCAVVSPGWRPYWNNGCWLWSDCGWYWNSYYSWGWGPFHYGNWCNAPGYGWCWAPGSTWGPSWVTFRYSAGYCGWAPLPPGCVWKANVGLTWAGAGIGVGFGFGCTPTSYCWTPTSSFCHPTGWKHGVSGKRVEQLFKDSTVINNYVVGNNNTIINNGIDSGQIQKQSRGEIRKVQLADAPSAAAAGSLAATTTGSDGGRFPVYRPTVSSSASGLSSGGGARSEVRPTQLASRSRTAPDRFSLPVRPTPSQALGAGASTQPRLPATSPNPTGTAVALHNNRAASGNASISPGNLPARGSVSPARPPNNSSSSQSGPVFIPSRTNPSSRSFTPNSQRPTTAFSGRAEPRKSMAPTSPGYQPGSRQSINPRPSGSNFRSTPAVPSRGSNPSFSRPQGSSGSQGRPSFSSGQSFNSAPRSAPSGGGGRSGGGGVRPGPRGGP